MFPTRNHFIKPFVFGFLLVAVLLLFFTRVQLPEQQSAGFFQVKINNRSATADFFSHLKKRFPGSVTAESLAYLICFEKRTKLTAPYFTDPEQYARWFYADDGFQSVYVPRSRNPFMPVRLYLFLSHYAEFFAVEESLFHHFFSVSVCGIFFLVLLYLSREKILFALYASFFLLNIFFTKDFIFVVATILILYALFFLLYSSCSQTSKIRKLIARNKILASIFTFACVLPLATFPFVSRSENSTLFALSFLCFCITASLVQDLKSLNFATQKKAKIGADHLSDSDLTYKSFFHHEHFLSITLTAIIALSVSFIGLFILKNHLPKQTTALSFVSAQNSTASFSAENFFTAAKRSTPQTECAGLDCFVRDCWVNAALDYTRVDRIPALEHEPVIHYNMFVERDGKIVEVQEVILEFNTAFIEKCLHIFFDKESTLHDSVYEIMLAQKGFAHFSNIKKTVRYERDWFQLVIFLLSIGVCIGVGLYGQTEKERKRKVKIDLLTASSKSF